MTVTKSAHILDESFYSYTAFLEQEAVKSHDRKRDRTKAHLIASTAKLMEANGLQGLTHTDVCKAANINVATFYRYFENKAHIFSYLIERFFDFLMVARDPHLKRVRDHARKQIDPYGDIFTANLHILRLAAANPGLYRCVLNQGSENDSVAMKWQAFSQQHAVRGAHRVLRARADASIEELTLKATLLGGMIDDFCKNFFVLAEPSYCATWKERFEDETEMAIFLSDVWYETMMNKPAPLDKSEWLDLVSEEVVFLD